jgi:hypothetical protein
MACTARRRSAFVSLTSRRIARLSLSEVKAATELLPTMPMGRFMNSKLIFWIVFWPGFLLALLLDGVRIDCGIQDSRLLMLAFGLYILLCGLRILLAVKRLVQTA